jgi:hypothetical protein
MNERSVGLFRIWEAPASNLDSETGHTYFDFSSFLLNPSKKAL